MSALLLMSSVRRDMMAAAVHQKEVLVGACRLDDQNFGTAHHAQENMD
jgi:hypothetical protein